MSLIITCPRNLEKKAAKEILEFVKEIDSIKPDIIDTNLSGIFMVDTDIDPDEFIDPDTETVVEYKIETDTSIVQNECVNITENAEEDEKVAELAEKRMKIKRTRKEMSLNL